MYTCSPLSPLHDQIDLWFVFTDDVPNSVFSRYRRLLTDEERAKEQRFYFPRHRRQYLITRALVRTVLSRYCDVRPEQWRFGAGARGRPLVLNADESARALAFNLSHTDGLIVCGVTGCATIGVDVENVQRRDVSRGIAERFFSEQEAATLRGLSPALYRNAFFHYWTLKESYIKARGEGLAIPLGQFSFNSPESPHIAFSFDASLNDVPSRWKFWLLQASAEHLAAVCVHEPSARAAFACRRTVPLEREEEFDCQIVRRSP